MWRPSAADPPPPPRTGESPCRPDLEPPAAMMCSIRAALLLRRGLQRWVQCCSAIPPLYCSAAGEPRRVGTVPDAAPAPPPPPPAHLSPPGARTDRSTWVAWRGGGGGGDQSRRPTRRDAPLVCDVITPQTGGGPGRGGAALLVVLSGLSLQPATPGESTACRGKNSRDGPRRVLAS